MPSEEDPFYYDANTWGAVAVQLSTVQSINSWCSTGLGQYLVASRVEKEAIYEIRESSWG